MTQATKVQIYLGAATAEDVALCIKAGTDLIGLVADRQLIGNRALGGHVLPGLEMVADYFATVPPGVMTVALTFDSAPEHISEMAALVRPRVIHLAGNSMLTVEQLASLRSRHPHIKFMQAIAINRPNAIDLALTYQSLCDYFILDSKGDESDHPYGVGATGEVHDWALSAELVRAVNIPVILAGGLTPENVREAVARVGPWGVDSFTQTNVTPDRESRKDPFKVRAFVANAKRQQ